MFEKISNYKNTLIATGAAAVAAVAVGALAYRGNLTPLAKATASKVSALKPYIASFLSGAKGYSVTFAKNAGSFIASNVSKLSKATGLSTKVLTGASAAVATTTAVALSIIGYRWFNKPAIPAGNSADRGSSDGSINADSPGKSASVISNESESNRDSSNLVSTKKKSAPCPESVRSAPEGITVNKPTLSSTLKLVEESIEEYENQESPVPEAVEITREELQSLIYAYNAYRKTGKQSDNVNDDFKREIKKLDLNARNKFRKNLKNLNKSLHKIEKRIS